MPNLIDWGTNHWLSRKSLKAMADAELQAIENRGGVDSKRAVRELKRRKAISNRDSTAP